MNLFSFKLFSQTTKHCLVHSEMQMRRRHPRPSVNLSQKKYIYPYVSRLSFSLDENDLQDLVQ